MWRNRVFSLCAASVWSGPGTAGTAWNWLALLAWHCWPAWNWLALLELLEQALLELAGTASVAHSAVGGWQCLHSRRCNSLVLLALLSPGRQLCAMW